MSKSKNTATIISPAHTSSHKSNRTLT